MKKDEVIHIGDRYIAKPSGELCRLDPTLSKESGEVIGQTETAIANHTPLLKELRTIDDGTELKEELIFNVRRAGRMWGEVAYTMKDILSTMPNLKCGAACRIYIGRSMKAYYSEAMQIQCENENAPHTVIYAHTGYTIIDGKRVFLNGGYSVTAEGLTDQYTVRLQGELGEYGFTNEKHESRYNTLLRDLPAIAPKNLVFTGLGYSFLTPLNALLREKGVEPRFILYFDGKTGSGKTSVAKLFLDFFGNFKTSREAPCNFRDSVNSTEKKFSILDSTLTLLDDRRPTTSLKDKADLENKEQNSIRMIGDRAARARMNADGTLKPSYVPKCNLIITAEDAFANVGESGVARAITVEIVPTTLDMEALFKVQAKAEELNECMSEYIQYVLSNWGDLGEKLESLFFDLRNKAQRGGHGRLAESVAHLQIGIIAMCQWLESIGQITATQAQELQATSWEIFLTLAKEQDRRITGDQPVKLFLDAVKEMRDRGEIRFDDINAPMHSIRPIGYKDKYFYYCYPDSLYSEVKRFYSQQDITFPLSKSALFRQLAIDKVIETDRQQTTKAKRIGDKRSRFLWIRANALDDEAKEVTDNAN